MRGRISSATGGVLWYSRYIWINTINAFSPIKWKCQIYHCSCIRRMRTSAVQQKFGGSPCLECGDTFSVERWTVLKSTYLSFGASAQSWVLAWNENLNPQTKRHRTGACAPVKKVGRIWFIMIEKSLENFIGKLLEISSKNHWEISSENHWETSSKSYWKNIIGKSLQNFIGNLLGNLVEKLLEITVKNNGFSIKETFWESEGRDERIKAKTRTMILQQGSFSKDNRLSIWSNCKTFLFILIFPF